MDTKNNSYQNIASFYDSFQGVERAQSYLESVEKQLGLKQIENLKVLEVACGTGEILKLLSSQNKAYGIDISPEMIDVARQKDKKSIYLVGDMRSFDLEKDFDLILCPYDSINHLLIFDDWIKTFINIKNHLKNKGIFVFDYNTPEKFKRIDNKSIKIDTADGYVKISTKLEGNLCKWRIEKFSKTKSGFIKEEDAEVIESSYPENLILKSLEKIFKGVFISKLENGRNLLVCKT